MAARFQKPGIKEISLFKFNDPQAHVVKISSHGVCSSFMWKKKKSKISIKSLVFQVAFEHLSSGFLVEDEVICLGLAFGQPLRAGHVIYYTNSSVMAVASAYIARARAVMMRRDTVVHRCVRVLCGDVGWHEGWRKCTKNGAPRIVAPMLEVFCSSSWACQDACVTEGVLDILDEFEVKTISVGLNVINNDINGFMLRCAGKRVIVAVGAYTSYHELQVSFLCMRELCAKFGIDMWMTMPLHSAEDFIHFMIRGIEDAYAWFNVEIPVYIHEADYDVLGEFASRVRESVINQVRMLKAVGFRQVAADDENVTGNFPDAKFLLICDRNFIFQTPEPLL